MDGMQFVGTITPTEARKTIFEDIFGLTQANLASVTIGYNCGIIMTYKLKQQFDVDQLHE